MTNIVDYNNFDVLFKSKCNKNYAFRFTSNNKIIVIGDLHGDFDKLQRILIDANLIDNNNNWIGKDTILVQVGDQIDSCRPIDNIKCIDKNIINDKADDLKIIYYLNELDDRARKHKGRVLSLLGNHELMNVDGDYTYVSKKNFDIFNTTDVSNNCNTYKQRRDYFSPGNRISVDLACNRHVILIIDRILFVHAGIIQQLIDMYDIQDINKLMIVYLLDNINSDQKMHFNKIFRTTLSPLHTREYSKFSICNELDKILKKLNVDKIIVGHTPKKISNMTNCNKKIIFVDFEISKAFDIFYPHNYVRPAYYLKIIKENNKNKYYVVKTK